jgi:hypothetical protein
MTPLFALLHARKTKKTEPETNTQKLCRIFGPRNTYILDELRICMHYNKMNVQFLINPHTHVGTMQSKEGIVKVMREL